MSREMLEFGIAGIGGRPQVFLDAFEKSGRARLTAVCDRNAESMAKAVSDLPGVRQYTDYVDMLESEHLDAVIIGTPMPLHIPQSVEALRRNVNVFSEVTAGVSVEECRQLAEACRQSEAQYMMGENCCYMRPYMTVKNMVRDGLLGNLFYAEGEYNHDCRELITLTPWRKTWLYDIAGVNYGTHSLGPILSWLEGDRVTSVSCAGSAPFSSDLQGAPLTQGSCYVMLCKTEQGRLIKIKNNLSSARPYGLNFVLEGSEGVYQGVQCGRGAEDDLIHLGGISAADKWDALAKHEEKYLPDLWRKYPEMCNTDGHLGADLITMIDFIDHIYEGKKVPIDVHSALDMTLPGLLSQESVRNGGAWVSVPDSRLW